MTIKEIAAKAGVSIATVSHVINHTRYVSPELVDKIEAIIEESGYSEKIKKKVRKIRSGRSSQIVAVFPNIKSALYCDLCNQLQSYATSQGYQFYTAATNDSPGRGEKHPAKLNLQCQDHRHLSLPGKQQSGCLFISL